MMKTLGLTISSYWSLVAWIFLLLVVDSNLTSSATLNSRQPLSVLVASPSAQGHALRVLALGESLAQRGHNVTFCTTLNWERLDRKAMDRGMRFLSAGEVAVNETVFRDVYREMARATSSSSANPFTAVKLVSESIGYLIHPVADYLAKVDLTQWDVIIIDYILDHTVSCLAKHQNVPIISVVNRIAQPHLNPEWPFPFHISTISDDMTFADRLDAAVKYFLTKTLIASLVNPFRMSSIDPICSASFHLTNPQCVEFPCLVIVPIGLEFPRTISPLTEHVGPMFLSDDNKALKPVELSEWLSTKPARSVVYISMGSLAEQTRQLANALVNGLISTRYDVVWSLKKSNQYILDGLQEIDSSRFFISNWVSQFKLLQHPAIAMVIVHGGTGGITEALYNRVPIIVVPFGADQTGNAARVQSAGAGIALQQAELTPAVVRDSVERILAGDYRKKAEQMRKIFDGAGGVNRASDLVELYADIGYQHLIPAYAKYKWSWVQYYNADVLAVLCLLLAGVLYCTARLCKCCCSRRKKIKNE